MQTVTIRPLRRIKKTGKVTAANYMQWRKVKISDREKFNLVVDNEYKNFPLDEFVYNHKGELLFWRDFNPAEIPIHNHSALDDIKYIREGWDEGKPGLYINGQEVTGDFGMHWGKGRISYSVLGLDCDGLPTFSHYNADRAAESSDVNEYEPLTVGMVVKWFGWFLLQLDNSYLQIGKTA